MNNYIVLVSSESNTKIEPIIDEIIKSLNNMQHDK